MSTYSEDNNKSKPSTESEALPSLDIFMLIDCSSSMVEGDKIEWLNQAMFELIPYLRKVEHDKNIKLYLRVIKFSSGAEWHINEPALIDNVEWKELTASGKTDTGASFRLVTKFLENNSERYKGNYPPAIILISDGIPTDDYTGSLLTLLKTKCGSKSSRFVIAIGEYINEDPFYRFVSSSKLGKLVRANSNDELGTGLHTIFETFITKSKLPRRPTVAKQTTTRPREQSRKQEGISYSIERLQSDTSIVDKDTSNKNLADIKDSHVADSVSHYATPSLIQQPKISVGWFDKLPFPLASILWRYYAEVDDRLKTENLIHYFEALAQFTCMLFLSAFRSDQQFFEENRKSWMDVDIRRSTFGTWVILGERLAKFTRRLLSDNSTRTKCIRMFGTQRLNLLEAITDKTLFQVLKTVNDYRNNWQGHGGVASREEFSLRRLKLEDELFIIQNVFSNAFDGYILLRPLVNEYENGIYYNTVNNLMGTRSYFRKEIANTVIPLDKKKLFLKDLQSDTPLQLIPLIKMEREPKTEPSACYFFNRIVNNEIRWVSYHYEPLSEITTSDQELLLFINELGGPYQS